MDLTMDLNSKVTFTLQKLWASLRLFSKNYFSPNAKIHKTYLFLNELLALLWKHMN